MGKGRVESLLENDDPSAANQIIPGVPLKFSLTTSVGMMLPRVGQSLEVTK